MASTSIYILRHCDKDLDNSKNGCAVQGYQRAVHWKNYFDQKNLKNPVFYAFGFAISKCKGTSKNRTNKCPVDPTVVFTKDDPASCDNFNYSKCSASQRAFLTICPLASSYNSEVVTEFCVGDETALVADIYQQNILSDIVVVWEHNAIIDLLKKVAKYFSTAQDYLDWSSKDDSYNLLFTIPRSSADSTKKVMPTITVQCDNGVFPDDDCSNVRKFITAIDPTATAQSWLLSPASQREGYAHDKGDGASGKKKQVSGVALVFLLLFGVLVIVVACYFMYRAFLKKKQK